MQGNFPSNFQEIRSHSSLLNNLEMNRLFTMLDESKVQLKESFSVNTFFRVFSVLSQIYLNVRNLFFYNPHCRAVCNLDTKVEGVYVIDCMLGFLQFEVDRARFGKFSYKDMSNGVVILDHTEMLIRRGLQFFSYFYRLDYKQKPDLDNVGKMYQSKINDMSEEKIRGLAGKDQVGSFESLGGEDFEIEKGSIGGL